MTGMLSNLSKAQFFPDFLMSFLIEMLFVFPITNHAVFCSTVHNNVPHLRFPKVAAFKSLCPKRHSLLFLSTLSFNERHLQ